MIEDMRIRMLLASDNTLTEFYSGLYEKAVESDKELAFVNIEQEKLNGIIQRVKVADDAGVLKEMIDKFGEFSPQAQVIIDMRDALSEAS